jgi:hypothetical protein
LNTCQADLCHPVLSKWGSRSPVALTVLNEFGAFRPQCKTVPGGTVWIRCYSVFHTTPRLGNCFMIRRERGNLCIFSHCEKFFSEPSAIYQERLKFLAAAPSLTTHMKFLAVPTLVTLFGTTVAHFSLDYPPTRGLEHDTMNQTVCGLLFPLDDVCSFSLSICDIRWIQHNRKSHDFPTYWRKDSGQSRACCR